MAPLSKYATQIRSIRCRKVIVSLLSLSLFASSSWQSANATMESFGWNQSLIDARDTYEAAAKEEVQTANGFENAQRRFQESETRLIKALAQTGLRQENWEENRTLARRHQLRIQRLNARIGKLQLKLKSDRFRIAKIADEIEQIKAEPVSLQYDQDAKIEQLETEATSLLAEVSETDETLASVIEDKAALEKRYLARQAKLRPSTDIYADIFTAIEEQGDAKDGYEIATEAYSEARKAAAAAALDYYARFENNRPPYIERILVKHGKRLIYEAEWKPFDTGRDNSDTEKKIIKDALAKEQDILALSRQRIAILEHNRTTYRVHINDARQQAQVLQRRISNTQINAIAAKAALELAVVAAEVTITGGALSVASRAAGASVQTAVKAYSKEFAAEFAKKDALKIEIREILSKLTAAATAKKLEDRISERYANKGYDGIGKNLASEVTEWAVGETVGGVLSSIHSATAEEAGKVAFGKAASTTAERIAAKGVVESANAGSMKSSLAVAATEVLGKVLLAYRTDMAVEKLATQKLAKQIEVIITQWQWNKVHEALLKERLRANRIEARVAALKTRLKFGRVAFNLDVKINEVLTPEDIKSKHNLDILFETSERLQFAPEIERLDGFEPDGIERDVRRGENWWKAFAVLDEEQLATRSDLPIAIRKDESLTPYGALDSNPGTSPKLVNLQDPSWDGFEPGADQNHAIKLQDNSTNYVCALPEVANKPNDESTIVAGIVQRETLADCSYWGVEGFGVLAMQRSGDEFTLEWAKTFKYDPTSNHDTRRVLNRRASGIRYWDFDKGPFIKARIIPPPTDDDIWDDDHFVLTGTAQASVSRNCGMRDAPEKNVQETLGETVYMLMSPLVSGHYDGLVGRGALTIVFDRSEMFKRETVYTVQASEFRTERYIGIPDCVRHLYPATPAKTDGGGLDFQKDTSTPKSGRVPLHARRLDAGIGLDDITLDKLAELTSDDSLKNIPYVAPDPQKQIELMNQILERGEHPGEARWRQFMVSVDDHIPFTGAELDQIKWHQNSLNE